MPTPTAKPNSSLVSLKAGDGDDVPTVVGKTPRSPVVESLALAAGSTLGHFEIIAPLGSGGMASVLKARDTHLGRLVALKILPPEAARDPDAVARFKHEARAAAKLDHENVARVFFSGEDRGLHFIAFEFVEGDTLRARIERLGHLGVPEAVRFLLHTAAGLQHLNERGVVHRDIKPSNVVVTPDGRAKLIDLGLARHLETASVNGGVTQSGMTLGTFDYISPEQARDPRTADVRADIYSLGCTFYHALTGRPPVPEGTAAVKLSAQQLIAPTDPRELNPDVPDSLAMVLNRMLMKDPARRYQSPAELTAAVAEVARQLGLPTDGTGSETPAYSSSTTFPRLAPEPPPFPTGWVVACVVLLAVGLVIASLTGGRDGGQTQLPWDDPPPKVLPVEVPPKDDGPKRPAPAGPVAVATAAELLAAAGSDVAQLTLQPGVVYDLSATGGLLFTGRKLSLECADPRKPAVVRVAISPIPADHATVRLGGLTVAKADAVSFRGVRFELVERPGLVFNPEDMDYVPPVGVAILDAAKVDVLECSWEADAKAARTDATALYLGRPAKSKPVEFAARNSYFGTRRWTAVEFAAPVAGTVAECGFATGRAGIRLTSEAENPGTDSASALALKHCTFLLDHRAAAVAVESVRAAITAGFCVFAAPSAPDPAGMMMTDAEKKAVTLSFTGDSSNVSFSAVAGEPSGYFRAEVPPGAVGNDSVDLPVPWKTVPPSPDKSEPWKALELNPAVRKLRVSQPAGVHILGASQLPVAGGRIYADWPPGGTTANSPRQGVRVWYPNPPAAEKGQLPKGVYEDIAKALEHLRPNEELHIRANGPVRMPTQVWAKPNVRLTVAADEGFAPILVPAADGPLFRVEDGELRLERLHIKLSSADEMNIATQSAVVLAGGKRCAFSECTVTGDDTVSETSAVVAVIPPAVRAETEVRPEVRFEKCLVRGTGRLVRMTAAQPATVAVGNSLVALTGPVIELAPPDQKPPAGASVRVQLARSTLFLAGPLVEMTLTDIADPTYVPVQVEADGNLFAPADKPAPPLLKTVNGEAASAARYFQWQTGTGNGFANFPARSVFLEIPPKRLETADWLTFTKEKKAALGKLTFAKPPTGPRTLAALLPADTEVSDSELADDLGAKPAMLPKPPDEKEK